MDKSGNLEGTTINSWGNDFELVAPATHRNRPWSEVVLHAFTNDINGNPSSDLLADHAGNLFGYGAGRKEAVLF